MRERARVENYRWISSGPEQVFLEAEGSVGHQRPVRCRAQLINPVSSAGDFVWTTRVLS